MDFQLVQALDQIRRHAAEREDAAWQRLGETAGRLHAMVTEEVTDVGRPELGADRIDRTRTGDEQSVDTTIATLHAAHERPDDDEQLERAQRRLDQLADALTG